MIEHRLAPPTTNGGEAQKSALVDMRDHKADFIHMADNRHLRPAVAFAGDKATEAVEGDFIDAGFQRVNEKSTNFLFIAADGAGFA